MKTMNKLCVCVVVFALLVVASQVRATPERALTKAESWSAYGGDGGMCKTGWGRCYTDPMWADCSIHEEGDCENQNIVRTLGTGITCQNSPNELEFNCTEQGNQVACIEASTCFWYSTNEYNGMCVADLLGWHPTGGVTQGSGGAIGDDCL